MCISTSMIPRLLLSSRAFGKSIILRTVRKTATNTYDNILIYSNKEFKLIYARLLAITAPIYVGVIGAAVKYKHSYPEENTNSAVQVYKKYGNHIALMLCVASGIIGWKINSFVKVYIREIFVSSNQRKVTFVLYRLFGQPKVFTVAVNDVMLQNNKVILKNLKTPLVLGRTGQYPNQSLFNKAMGLYRQPFQ